jgi:hypothetical protein
MIAGGLGSIDAGRPRRSCSRRHAADPAGRPRHAHRHGRQRRQLDGHRRQRGRTRLRLGAARQPRDRAPRAGGHQPLLAAGRRPTRSWRSTTWARAACQCLPRADQRRRPRRALRPARRAAGRVGPGAQGNLVQRKPGALRAGDRARVAAISSRPSASASAARLRWSAWRPKKASWWWPTAPRGRAGRHADGRAAGQAAQDAPRREAVARKRSSRST